MIDNIRSQIEDSLESFLEKVKNDYKLHLVHPILFEAIKDFTLRKGKRIRPILLILSYKAYSPDKGKLPASFYNAATCIEFLHNFMLIHDDIIDRSDLRRGKPTLHRLLAKAAKTKEHEKLGYDLSIIAGDIVYALAIDAFLSIQVPPQRKELALKYFIQTAAFTAMGEFIDILHGVQKINEVKEKDVFLNYTLKTARYTFECPLVVGAILAGASDKETKLLSELGIHIGQAFQIQDDILGIFDSEQNIGKSILSDIAEYKKTILVCHAFETLKGKKKSIFLKHFNKPTKSYEDLVAIRKIFVESGSLEYSLKAIQVRVQEAKKIIAKLKMHPTYHQLIGNSLLSLFKRGHELGASNNIVI